MEDSTDVSQLILHLLSKNSPELGARLKQRLNKALNSNGRPRFDEKALGYRKFAEFLHDTLSDYITIDLPATPGDLSVSLKRIPLPAAHKAPPRQDSPRIRSDVWQAFTNPDPLRKRFFQRDNRAILHFLSKRSESYQEQLNGNPQNFVEIEEISAQNQIQWMHELLDEIKLESGERAPLEALISAGYSSSANAAFTRALGEHEEKWRRYRTRRVAKTIETWAQEHHVAYDELCEPKTDTLAGQSSPALAAAPAEVLTPRQQAEQLLKRLDDEEIAKIVIPAMLSYLLTTSRI